jgi:hypothetical protein
MSVAIPQFMKKIQKSLYGTVRFTVPTWHAGGRQIFFTMRVLCLLIFSHKLKQEEWISSLNE